MKIPKTQLIIFSVIIIFAMVYRLWDNRPIGFTPYLAIAMFAGYFFSKKVYSFLFTFTALFLSDMLIQILYWSNLFPYPGIYNGILINYILIVSITAVGILIQRKKRIYIIGAAIGSCLFFYIVSNFSVWIGGGLAINNFPYPKNISGLIECYVAGLPFLRGNLISTIVLSLLLFGLVFLRQSKHRGITSAPPSGG